MSSMSNTRIHGFGDTLTHAGYTYVYDKISKNNPDITFWRCQKKDRCTAKAHLHFGMVTKVTKGQNHGVDEEPPSQVAQTRLPIYGKHLPSTSSSVNEVSQDVEQIQSQALVSMLRKRTLPSPKTSTPIKFKRVTGTNVVKSGFATMVKGGLIMDVVNAEQARIAEAAGACAVMALERVPADIRKDGGVARMSDPKLIKEIMAAVNIPVMAKVRVGHFGEAQIIQQLGVDMIDESEVLSVADEANHINKRIFKTPFVCGAKDLGEALRRISEGAAMIRTKGEAGTGNVVEAVRHARAIKQQIGYASSLDDAALYTYAKELQVPYDLLKETAQKGRLLVTNFAAGGLATPADVSLLMQLGVDGVFVGSGIFKSNCPEKRAKAMALAVTYYDDPKMLAEISEDLGEAMVGINSDDLKQRWEGR